MTNAKTGSVNTSPIHTPVVVWAGRPFFERAWASIRNRSLNMFSLIALGMGSAYLYRAIATLAPGIFHRRRPRRSNGCAPKACGS